MNITTELIAYLLTAAIKFSGLPAIEASKLPPFEVVTGEQLAQKMCPESPERCSSVAALFDTENYRIYLRNTLDMDSPMDNSFLVHEMVHVLQFKRYGDDYFSSCRKVVESEHQAYRAQNNYLGSEGIDWREGFLLRFMNCPPEEGEMQLDPPASSAK